MNNINEKLNFVIPNNALTIHNVLNNKGFETYFVGGALRDLFMNYYFDTDYKIKDWDITTTARFSDMAKLFNKLLRVNENGRIVSKISKSEMLIPAIETTGIFINNQMFEVTPMHFFNGEEISFTTNIIDDLSKRDFTINTIAYSPKHGWITTFESKDGDIIDAISDIKNKVIRSTQNADNSFKRNRFNMLRAIMFANRFDFTIEENTLNSIKDNIVNVNTINKGKMSIAFEKIIMTKCSSKIYYLKSTGLLNSLCEEWKDDYSDEFIKLLIEANSMCRDNFMERIKYIYDKFTNKEVLKKLYKSFGVNKECIFKLDF